MTDRINERNKEIMSSIFDKVQPAVKKETRKVAMITAVGLVLMWILFAGLHFAMPDKVPLDYTVFLGGIGGGLIAVLNFFLMGLAVQKAASATDEGTARMKLKASYSQRFLMMMGDRSDRCTVLPFCSGNCSTSVSGNGNQDRGDIS